MPTTETERVLAQFLGALARWNAGVRRFASPSDVLDDLVDAISALAGELRDEIGGGPSAAPLHASEQPLPAALRALQKQLDEDAFPAELQERVHRLRALLPRLQTLAASAVSKLDDGESLAGAASAAAERQEPCAQPRNHNVLETLKAMSMERPIAYVVSGLENAESQGDDMTVLLRDPLDDVSCDLIKARIRADTPRALAERVHFISDAMGPIGSHAPIATMVVRIHGDASPRLVPVTGEDDPLQTLPASRGKRDAIVQYHFRGKTLHLDVRMQVENELVGWTLLNQRPGALTREVTTLDEAERLARTFSIDGDAISKPFRWPRQIQATPKCRHPLAWLDVQRLIVQPGDVGATAETPGVFYALDTPKVEFGLQTAAFHEYFFTESERFAGIMTIRHVRLREGEEPVWLCSYKQDWLPMVLSERAVETQQMPPDGISALPLALEELVAAEFRYWDSTGPEARQRRDALVASGLLTSQNVVLVDGEFARVEKRLFLTMPGTVSTTPVQKSARRSSVVSAPDQDMEWTISHARAEDRGAHDQSGRRIIRAVAVKRTQAADGAFQYACAIGPITGREREFHAVTQLGTESLVPIGDVASPLAIDVGATVEVEVPRLDAELATPKRIAWANARLLRALGQVHRPSSVDAVLNALRPDELHKVHHAYFAVDQPCVEKAEDERYTLGVVLVPDEEDAQHDIYTQAEVRRACHLFSEHYGHAGLMHREVRPDIVIVENYLLPVAWPDKRLPAGTWLQGRKYNNTEIWQRIKSGELRGLSIGGSAIRRPSKRKATTA